MILTHCYVQRSHSVDLNVRDTSSKARLAIRGLSNEDIA